MIGRTASHYRIDAKLGEGGMGEVSLGRRVALKFPPEANLQNEITSRTERPSVRRYWMKYYDQFNQFDYDYFRTSTVPV
jgi:hypothetical protein